MKPFGRFDGVSLSLFHEVEFAHDYRVGDKRCGLTHNAMFIRRLKDSRIWNTPIYVTILILSESGFLI